MTFSRIKNILISTNKKTNGAFFTLTIISLWFLISCILYFNGFNLLSSTNDDVTIALMIVSIIINGILYGSFATCVFLILLVLTRFGKMLVKIFRAFKEATEEEYKVEPNKNSKITF